MQKKYCCESMKFFINQKCDEHKNIYDCSDIIFVYNEKFDEYGIVIHDAGNSYIVINYCPLCGAKLPPSKRDLWFDELEKIGINSPLEEEIPEKFKTAEWWENK